MAIAMTLAVLIGGLFGMSAGMSTTRLSSARATLSAYDEGHRRAAAEGGRGMGGALSANEWSETADRPQLRAAITELAAHSQRVMLGICAHDPGSGVAELKSWVEGLGLPRGKLHGMDRDGIPLDMTDFGPCYIKYNSLPTGNGDPAGTALLSGYGGDFRGVYFSPDLGDDAFDQYGVIPLGLFGSGASGLPLLSAVGSAAAASAAGQASGASSSTLQARGPPALSSKLVEQAVADILP